MNLKPYPKYKDSGIEWLGEIPEGWEVKRLKWLASLEYGSSLSEDDREEGDVPVYGSNGIVGKHSKSITGSPAIIIGRKGSYGKVSYSEDLCFPIDTTYYIDPSLTKENIRWLYYLLSSINLDEITFDTGVPGLSRGFAYSKIVPVPIQKEQSTIANFLDHKTSKIDELIKNNERLIELLKEKRQAIISCAVTKGLDPNAKMKDSGIEWIGKIPEGWVVRKLKYLTAEKFKNGIFKKKEFYGSGIKLINVFDVYRQDFYIEIESLDRVEVTSQEVQTYSVKAGDIVFVRSSLKLEGVGASACVPSLSEPLLFECHLVKLQPSSKILPEYLTNFLNSSIVRQRLIALANTVTMATLGQSALTNIEVELPPIFEQQAILKYLKNETAKIDELINKIQTQSEKLKEYRQALISNVVTGKVRAA